MEHVATIAGSLAALALFLAASTTLAADDPIKENPLRSAVEPTPTPLGGIIPNQAGKETITKGPIGPDPMSLRIPRGTLGKGSSSNTGIFRGMRPRKSPPPSD